MPTIKFNKGPNGEKRYIKVCIECTKKQENRYIRATLLGRNTTCPRPVKRIHQQDCNMVRCLVCGVESNPPMWDQ